MEHADPTRESYEALPYERLVHRFTHPDRIALAGTAPRVRPGAVPTARVLELGCASGDNLVGMAYGLPAASFAGVDLSAARSRPGGGASRRSGSRTSRLVAGDLGDVDGSWGTFDYVVAHGVLSWVPEPVRRRLLEVCRERLSPEGVAFVSYNALPGWRFRRLVRDVLLAGAAGAREPRERARLARERLALVAANVFDAASPWGRYLVERADGARGGERRGPPPRLPREQNEAFSLRDVVGRARRPVSSTSATPRSPSFPRSRRRQVRGALEALPDEVDREELLDVLRERTLRQGLFVRAGGPARPPAPTRPAQQDLARSSRASRSRAGCPASPAPRQRPRPPPGGGRGAGHVARAPQRHARPARRGGPRPARRLEDGRGGRRRVRLAAASSSKR